MASYSKKKTLDGYVWQVWFRFNENGKTVTKHLSGFKTKKDAQQAVLKYAPAPAKKSQTNFEAVWRDYMCGRSGTLALSSHYDIGRIFERHILPVFSSKDISRIGKPDIIKWQTDMWNKLNPRTGKVYSQKTCINVRSAFNTFMSWVADSLNFQNPFDGVKIPKRREMKREMNVWTEEEFERFCSKCPSELVLFYKVLFYSGARVGEINALNKEDILLDGDRYILNIKKSVTRNTGGLGYVVSAPKTQSSNRKVPLPRALTEEITAFLSGKDRFVFGSGTPLNDHKYQRAFAKASERAGLKKIRIHDLRHSHATMLINAGVPITTVSKRLGHSSVKMTLDIYSHCYDKKEDEAVRMLDEIISENRSEKNFKK